MTELQISCSIPYIIFVTCLSTESVLSGLLSAWSHAGSVVVETLPLQMWKG
jgi:hypothetical protein